ncbi:MAG TPA: PP2C family protein-serine/threonine phosphatase [Acidimicrobiales bacterium]|nr:PP2C family protein-serine/threonine phosphatase [Acidimicrobiales bacterium]
MEQPVLALAALTCAIAAAVWGRSARYRLRVLRQVEDTADDADLEAIARSDYRKDLHTTVLYGILAVVSIVDAFAHTTAALLFTLVVAVPAVASVLLGRNFVQQARLEQNRAELERRAQEVLVQDELAPRRWAERLAPGDLPDIAGFELGRVYQAGSGLMAGDFYDVVRVAPTRIAAVIGDVTGHGIDPAITAFQAKYLLRVFLRQFRDPAQALEELNAQMSAMGRHEEFISLCVVVFDTAAGTLRFASAGHPAVWLWHERDVNPLRATGPLLMLDAKASYYSREIRLDPNDLCLMYTDGLAEARNGELLFGEERVANQLRRDPGAAPDVLCKALLEAARDFSSGPITDDVAILAVRRV